MLECPKTALRLCSASQSERFPTHSDDHKVIEMGSKGCKTISEVKGFSSVPCSSVGEEKAKLLF